MDVFASFTNPGADGLSWTSIRTRRVLLVFPNDFTASSFCSHGKLEKYVDENLSAALLGVDATIMLVNPAMAVNA